jgi:hypothetical protein
MGRAYLHLPAGPDQSRYWNEIRKHAISREECARVYPGKLPGSLVAVIKSDRFRRELRNHWVSFQYLFLCKPPN